MYLTYIHTHFARHNMYAYVCMYVTHLDSSSVIIVKVPNVKSISSIHLPSWWDERWWDLHQGAVHVGMVELKYG